MFNKDSVVGVVGSGAMGSGIAQVAATAGHAVKVFDSNVNVLKSSQEKLNSIMNKLVEKGKLDKLKANEIKGRISYVDKLEEFNNCDFIIEAIVEHLSVKQEVFSKLENIVSDTCVLASNTSSLSIASIASSCENVNRVMGVHFFNPAPLMPLVEIIPGIGTDKDVMNKVRSLVDSWGKVTVLAKDTPGFIVNRVARSFYGESIRIYEEGIADFATIDWALKTIGGFRMGPFELMDFIGNDVNYKVTETVWEQFFYEPRFKPSLTQKRLYEAKWFGRKSGRGYYQYSEGAVMPQPNEDKNIGQAIVDRILVMLMNEAIDSLYLRLASREDIDLAMTKGVNYPKGLLAWLDEWGAEKVLTKLNELYEKYQEERYRPSILLKQLAANGSKVYS